MSKFDDIHAFFLLKNGCRYERGMYYSNKSIVGFKINPQEVKYKLFWGFDFTTNTVKYEEINSSVSYVVDYDYGKQFFKSFRNNAFLFPFKYYNVYELREYLNKNIIKLKELWYLFYLFGRSSLITNIIVRDTNVIIFNGKQYVFDGNIDKFLEKILYTINKIDNVVSVDMDEKHNIIWALQLSDEPTDTIALFSKGKYFYAIMDVKDLSLNDYGNFYIHDHAIYLDEIFEKFYFGG